MNENNTNKSKTDKILIFLTAILTISQIFNIFYTIYSKIYTSLDKFLIMANMILLTLINWLLVIFISCLSIKIISRCLTLKKNKYLNLNFKDFLLKNIIYFIVNILFLLQIMFSGYLYFFNLSSKIDIIIYIILILPIGFSIFFYVYTDIIDENKVYQNNKLNKIIEIISNNKLLKTSIVISALMVNILICFKIYILPKEYYTLEKEIYIKEQIKKDNQIKYDIIIDRLLEKIDIKITDEDIEEYKKELKEKYKMEE